MGVVRINSCFSYQGGDCVWAQQCTVAVLMQSNRSGGPGRSPFNGCIRNRINLEKQGKVNSNSFGINSAP